MSSKKRRYSYSNHNSPQFCIVLNVLRIEIGTARPHQITGRVVRREKQNHVMADYPASNPQMKSYTVSNL